MKQIIVPKGNNYRITQEKIKRCIEEEKKFFDYFEKSIYETEDSIVVQLHFK